MIIGSQNEERPDHEEPVRATTDDDPEMPSDDDETDNSESTWTRILSAARTVSEIVSPFTGLLTSIVQLLTAWQFIRKL